MLASTGPLALALVLHPVSQAVQEQGRSDTPCTAVEER